LLVIKMKQFDKHSVTRFIGHFTERKKDISGIVCNSPKILKKILYFAIIDALSKSAFPDINHNKARFVKTLIAFSGWNDGERISLPFLYNDISDSTNNNIEPLQKGVGDELKKWPVKTPAQIKLSRDSHVHSLLSLIEHKNEKDELSFKEMIEKFSHYNLLWEYRNCLVHEFRQPGYGHELEGDDFPFYQGALGTDEIRLCYPVQFIANLIEQILKNLEKHLINNQINPYNSFEYGAFWNKKRNH